MGNTFGASVNPWGKGRKRKREDDETADEGQGSRTENDGSDTEIRILHTPKRKRVKSTSKYIYQRLFLDGENSDVKIVALGKEWSLHRLYLSQSPYFASMFSGSWKESQQSVIKIDVTDKNIDQNALKIAFGSLYKDDVFIKPVEAIGVIAAATLLQLDGLLQHCVGMMKDTISSTTVLGYHDAASMYGLEEVLASCLDWLLHNLLTVQITTSLLTEISVSLMSSLVASPQLFVIQVETDIYSMLKRWMFLHLNTQWSGNVKDLMSDSEAYYIHSAQKERSLCFLETDEGRRFIPAFQSIRWLHVITDITSMKMLNTDKILPMAWIHPVIQHQWKHMLQIEQGIDKGPETVDQAKFDALCSRCGRILPREGEYCWRWVGYNFGLDILISYSHRLLILKRNTLNQTCPHSVSLQVQRHLYYRLTVSSLGDGGRTVHSKSTSITKLSLGKDEEAIVMNIDRSLEFPLHVSLNVLLTSPVALPTLDFSPPTSAASISVQTEAEPGTMERRKSRSPRTLSHCNSAVHVTPS